MKTIESNGPALAVSIESKTHTAYALILLGGITALLAGSVTAMFGGPIVLTTVVVVLFTSFAFCEYRLGILIAMVLLPLSASRLLPREIFGITGLNPLNTTLVMAIASMTLAWVFQRNKVLIPRLPRPLVVYIGAIAAAALYGAQHVDLIPPGFQALNLINFDTSVGYLRDIFMKPMLILVTAFLLAVLVRNTHYPSRVLLPFFLSALVLPLFVIGYLVFTGVSLDNLASTQAREVLSVTGMHANELGMMFNMVLALALFTFLGARGLVKGALAIAIVVFFIAVLLTFSRGAYLGLLLLVAYFLFSQRRFKILLGAVVAVPLLFMLLPQAVVDRATTGVAKRNVEAITAGRVDNIWLPLAPEILDSPVVGHGLSSVLWSDAVRNGTMLQVGHPHNAYLGVLLDLGVVGAALVAWFFWRMHQLFRELRQRENNPLWQSFFQGATACILLLLVQGITDDRFTPTFAQVYLWLAYGIAIGLHMRLAESVQGKQKIALA